MTEPEQPNQFSFDIDAQGQAQVNAIGKIEADTVNFGDTHEGQRQIIVTGIDPQPPTLDTKTWIERKQVQADLLQRLEKHPLIEMVAAGGFGKTRLATWTYEQTKKQFSPALWVNFRKTPSFNAFARWVLQEMGFLLDERTSDDDLVIELTYRLSNKRALVVMDQLEAIESASDRPAFVEFLARWQKQGRNSAVLVTTRNSFIAGSAQSFILSGLTPEEGTQLLQTPNQAKQRQQPITTDLAEGLASLSRLAEGHPLLLEMAASWLQQTAQNQLTQTGLTFFEKLFQDYQGDPEAKVGEIFHTLLGELPLVLQRLLMQVSVYRDAFVLEQAQQMQPEATLADLELLESRVFLLRQQQQWNLHPLLLQFVTEALQAAGLEPEAHRKAIAFFEGRRQDGRVLLNDELEIVHHYCELGQYAAAYEVISPTTDWMMWRGYYRLLVRVYKRLTEEWVAFQPTDLEEKRKLGWAWISLGNAYQSLGECQRAIDLYQKALGIARAIGDRQGEANVLISLGAAYRFLGDYQRAIDLYQKALGIAREVGDRHGETSSLINLGNAYQSLGDYQRAIDLYQKALGIAREIGERHGEANVLISLGDAYQLLGDYQRAIDLYQKALGIAREIGDRRGEANVLISLGNAYHLLGNCQRAIDFQQQSLGIARETGNRQGEATSLGNLGAAYRFLGDYQRAIDFHQKALGIQRETGDRQGEAISLCGLGAAYELLGDYQRAIDFQQQCLGIAREIGNRHGEAVSLTNMGIVYRSLGDYQRAIDFHQKSLGIAREIGDRHGEASSLFNKALALAKLDDHWAALDSFQQARELFVALQIAHMVEKCDKAIRERNQIIAAIPIKAPSLRDDAPNPTDDWLKKSMPTTAPRQPSTPQNKWVPYILMGLVVVVIIVMMQR